MNDALPIRSRVILHVLLVAALALQGCAAGRGRPAAYLDREKLFKNLNRTHYLVRETGGSVSLRAERENPAGQRLDVISHGPRLQLLIEQYHLSAGASAAERSALRGEFVDLATLMIDLQFQSFVEQFSDQRKGIDTAADLGSIALDAAATLVTPSSTQAILAAISGGMTASKLAINKNYFYDQSLPVIVAKMHAERQQVYLDIIRGTQLPVERYNMSAALHDLARYYNAGTFEGAVASIQRDSGTQANQAQQDIREEISRGLQEQRQQQRTVQALVYQINDDAKVRAALLEVYAGFSDSNPETQTVRLGVNPIGWNMIARDHMRGASRAQMLTMFHAEGLLQLGAIGGLDAQPDLATLIASQEPLSQNSTRFDTRNWLSDGYAGPYQPTRAQLINLLVEVQAVGSVKDPTADFRDAATEKLRTLLQ